MECYTVTDFYSFSQCILSLYYILYTIIIYYILRGCIKDLKRVKNVGIYQQIRATRGQNAFVVDNREQMPRPTTCDSYTQ